MSEQSKSWRDSLPFFSSTLFHDVQLSSMFLDSKTFADAVPVANWGNAIAAYEQADKQGINLSDFVETHFVVPHDDSTSQHSVCSGARDFIEQMWDRLTRQPDSKTNSSLIPLPNSYLVPGGRFREIYYWDTYFTALGLMESGKQALVKAMVKNFLHVQQEIGCIPNGNRTYYHTRSQPPVLALIAQLLALQPGDPLMRRVYSGLKKEYTFWMDGAEDPGLQQAHRRVVKMPCGALLNRYYDDAATPRPESYKEDIHAAQTIPAGSKSDFFRNLRAACESGWDFSSRWLENADDLTTIQTTSIVPVDLNALLFTLETTLADMAGKFEEAEQQHYFNQCAVKRREAIHRYMWDEASGLFRDYHLANQRHTDVESLAATVALFAGIATPAQASKTAHRLERDFLRPGGLVTTLTTSSQQWDSPNGWAPLQWFAVQGLRQYGHTRLAETVMRRWVNAIESYFDAHQVILEKYNVCELATKAGGGEYDVQLGFGWTNGVTRKFYALLDEQD